MLWWPRSSGRGSAFSPRPRTRSYRGEYRELPDVARDIALDEFPRRRAATGPPQPTPACHHQGRTGGWRRSGRLGHGRRDGQRRDRLGLAWAAGSRLGHGGRRAGGGRRGRRLGRLDRPALVTPPNVSTQLRIRLIGGYGWGPCPVRMADSRRLGLIAGHPCKRRRVPSRLRCFVRLCPDSRSAVTVIEGGLRRTCRRISRRRCPANGRDRK